MRLTSESRRWMFLVPFLVSQSLTGQVTPRTIAAAARPAVVRITALVGGREISRGTGFFVSADGQLVTNHHVVEGADELRVELASGETYERIYVVSSDARRDIVILRIPATATPALEIADDRALEVGDRVYVMGNPMGLDGTFSDGLLSAKRTIDGIVLLQISAPISPGSSGGPVLNAQGKVVGIATLTLQDAQNVNMAVPARYASGLLAMNEEPRLFSEVAGEFASTDYGSSVHGTGAGPTSQTLEDMQDWELALLEEALVVDSIAVASGYVRTHEPYIDMLNEGEEDTIEFTFSETGTYLIVGVCDGDCDDLDMDIVDTVARRASDWGIDARPSLRFEVKRGGAFDVHVYMQACRVGPCLYALQAYREAGGAPRGPGTALR